MLQLLIEGQFEKDIQRALKHGKDVKKIKTIVTLLLERKQLPVKYRNHKLKGTYKDYWECHIEPDWLLVYKKTEKAIVLSRTGTHADLF